MLELKYILKNINVPTIIFKNHSNVNIINTLNDIYKIESINTYSNKVICKHYYYYDLSNKNDKIDNIIELIININNNKFITNKKIILDNINLNGIYKKIKNIIENNVNINIVLLINNHKYISELKSLCIYFKLPSDKIPIIYNDISNKIIQLYEIDSIDYKLDINQLKKITNNIILTCINITILLKVLLDKLLDNSKIIGKRKYQLISFISEAEYNYTKSYNKFVHIEYIFLNIYNICYL